MDAGRGGSRLGPDGAFPAGDQPAHRDPDKSQPARADEAVGVEDSLVTDRTLVGAAGHGLFVAHPKHAG
jgi:hypothetical protein